MQDYQKLIGSLDKDNITVQGRAVIAFGGSYGGMLAAWMRMKYPHKIQGAVASSAPILQFQGKTSPYKYTEIASNVIKRQGGDGCFTALKDGFYDLQNLRYDALKWQ